MGGSSCPEEMFQVLMAQRLAGREKSPQIWTSLDPFPGPRSSDHSQQAQGLTFEMKGQSKEEGPKEMVLMRIPRDLFPL